MPCRRQLILRSNINVQQYAIISPAVSKAFPSDGRPDPATWWRASPSVFQGCRENHRRNLVAQNAGLTSLGKWFPAHSPPVSPCCRIFIKNWWGGHGAHARCPLSPFPCASAFKDTRLSNFGDTASVHWVFTGCSLEAPCKRTTFLSLHWWPAVPPDSSC
jgi:hypothetical protein